MELANMPEKIFIPADDSGDYKTYSSKRGDVTYIRYDLYKKEMEKLEAKKALMSTPLSYPNVWVDFHTQKAFKSIAALHVLRQINTVALESQFDVLTRQGFGGIHCEKEDWERALVEVGQELYELLCEAEKHLMPFAKLGDLHARIHQLQTEATSAQDVREL